MSSNRHHRRPRSQGGTTNKPKGNCVRVDVNKHHFWHSLFDNKPGHLVAKELNTMWLDPAFIVVRRSSLAGRH